MFEKEAEEYLFDRLDPKAIDSVSEFSDKHIEEAIVSSFKDGAEFGYNKANKWRYPSKGEYPNDFEDVLICFLTEDDAKDCVRGWYEYDFENDKHIFKYLNVLEIQCLKTVFAWKKLVLPELPKGRGKSSATLGNGEKRFYGKMRAQRRNKCASMNSRSKARHRPRRTLG